MSRHIEIVEVGPRDGLQNESVMVSTEDKVALISDLVDAGVRRIEAVSFAHPTLVPQMADAEAVMTALPDRDDVTYIGLVMNERGWDRALAAGVDEVNFPIGASDTFSEKNQGMTTDEAMASFRSVAEAAGDAGIPISATISVAWGCPFEGEVDVSRVVAIAESAAAVGVREVALGDTIGVADPWAVRDRLEAVAAAVGDVPLRVHFHDTRNTGLANAFAAIEAGVSILDASVGGVGGCPFAPQATGNIPTDDLVYMLERAGFHTGLSLPKLIAISKRLGSILGKTVPAMLPRAGGFPA